MDRKSGTTVPIQVRTIPVLLAIYLQIIVHLISIYFRYLTQLRKNQTLAKVYQNIKLELETLGLSATFSVRPEGLK